MATTVTKEQVVQAVQIAAAVGDLIKTVGSVPSGHLYALLMGKMDYQAYTSCISILVRAKLVRQDMHHVLTWIGETSEDSSQTHTPTQE